MWKKSFLKLFSFLSAIILTTNLLVAMPFASEEQVTVSVDTIDEDVANHGYNYLGQLVMFTQNYAKDTTNTADKLQWWTKVIVNGAGKVTAIVPPSVSTDNVQIEAGGFVLAGHDAVGGQAGVSADSDEMATFLRENVSLGDKITFDSNTKLLTVTKGEAAPEENGIIKRQAATYNAQIQSESLGIYDKVGIAPGSMWTAEVIVEAKSNKVVAINAFDNIGGSTPGGYTKPQGVGTTPEYPGTSVAEGYFIIAGNDGGYSGDGIGDMALFLLNNVSIGSYVYYNSKTLEITFSKEPLDDMKETIFYTVSRKINVMNEFRDTNYLAIFTDEYIDEVYPGQTGTNAYGYEAVVDDDIIIAIGGNNNTIPEGGYVLSGHGTSYTWLKNYAKVGAKVSVSEEDGALVATISYTGEVAIEGLHKYVATLREELQRAKEEYRNIDYKKAEEAINRVVIEIDEAEKKYKNGDETGFAAADNACRVAENLLIENKTVDVRAVWIRPFDKSPEEVDATVQELYDAGINSVYMEIQYDSSMLIDTPDDLFVQHSNFISYDVLDAYLEACHKRGMELHVWMPVFLVGVTAEKHFENSIIHKKPEWASLSQNGEGYPVAGGFAMLDPANEEVVVFLLETYRYILENYNEIDGFQLDYIRYWDNTIDLDGNVIYDFGYTEASKAGFKELYGVEPVADTTWELWEQWKQYRRDQVTNFVEKVSKLIDEVNEVKGSDILLTADVAVDIEHCENRIYQDYTAWLEAGYLDMIHHMAYTFGSYDFIEEMIEKYGKDTLIVPGIGPYMTEMTATDMVNQTIGYSQIGAHGIAFFESQSFINKAVPEALKAGIYRDKAIAPFFDATASIQAILKSSKDRVNNIIAPFGGITDKEKDKLIRAIDNADRAVGNGVIGKGQMKALLSTINSLSSEKAKAALMPDISYAVLIGDIFSDFSNPGRGEKP